MATLGVRMRYLLLGLAMVAACNGTPSETPVDHNAEYERAFQKALKEAQAQSTQSPIASVRPGRDRNWPSDRDPHHAQIVSAFALADAYNGNALKADAQYLGQTIDVRGPVYRVERERDGTVALEIGKPLRKVIVHLQPAQESEAMELQVGRSVEIQGYGAGARRFTKTPLVEFALIVPRK